MPAFPDRFMPFMDQPEGSLLSAAAILTYGRTIRTLRRYNRNSLNQEPKWRGPGTELKTGYKPAAPGKP